MLGQFRDSLEDRWTSVLVLSVVAAILVILGVLVRTEFGSTGLTVLDFAVSGFLSAALVALYFRQAQIMKTQSDLLEQEMNREARQQHSETLRKRVEIWHGNPEKEVGETPMDRPTLNTPTVGSRSFNSANAEGVAFGGDESFHVIPQRLRDDRYLEDLLLNHAPDLLEVVKTIRGLRSKFVRTRATFEKEFEIEVTHEYEKFTIQETGRLAGWIFDLLVEQERGLYGKAIDRARSKVEDARTSPRREEPKIWFTIEVGGGTHFAILGADVKEEFADDLQEIRPEFEQAGAEVMEDVFQIVEEEAPYETVAEGAEILDDGRDAVNELERTLIEYHGRPIIPGDCKYLEEARAE